MFKIGHVYCFNFEFTGTFLWLPHSPVESIHWVLIVFSSLYISISLLGLSNLFQVCSYLLIEAYFDDDCFKILAVNSNTSVILVMASINNLFSINLRSFWILERWVIFFIAAQMRTQYSVRRIFEKVLIMRAKWHVEEEAKMTSNQRHCLGHEVTCQPSGRLRIS